MFSICLQLIALTLSKILDSVSSLMQPGTASIWSYWYHYFLLHLSLLTPEWVMNGPFSVSKSFHLPATVTSFRLFTLCQLAQKQLPQGALRTRMLCIYTTRSRPHLHCYEEQPYCNTNITNPEDIVQSYRLLAYIQGENCCTSSPWYRMVLGIIIYFSQSRIFF